MTLYSYRVRNEKGELIEDTIDSQNEEAVASSLREMNYYIIDIKETRPASKGFSIQLNLFNRIRPRDISVFTRQFSTLISSGMSLIESLEVLREQASNERFGEILLDVRRSVESGLTLSESLAKHPNIFSNLYISMVSAGEAGGVLDETLDKLAMFLEKEENIRLKIRNKTAYPKFVLGFAVFIMIVIILFIVPTFQGIYEELGVQLPVLTRIIIFIGDLFKKFYTYIILAILIFGGRYAFKKYINTPRGRYNFDSLRIKLPKVGGIIKKIALARFSRILGTLISAGIPILRSLDILMGVSGNKIIDNSIEEIKEDISEGEGMAEPMKNHAIFTPMMIQMVNVGEKSGALDDILNKVADFYDEEVNNSIETVITILEPILLLVVAVMVAIIVLSLYLPLFNVYQYIS